jgi:hypothetical protein
MFVFPGGYVIAGSGMLSSSTITSSNDFGAVHRRVDGAGGALILAAKLTKAVNTLRIVCMF